MRDGRWDGCCHFSLFFISFLSFLEFNPPFLLLISLFYHKTYHLSHFISLTYLYVIIGSEVIWRGNDHGEHWWDKIRDGRWDKDIRISFYHLSSFFKNRINYKWRENIIIRVLQNNKKKKRENERCEIWNVILKDINENII